MRPFYITTPIYYVNAKPHLGHAYTTIIADSMARFHRAMGQDTYFLTGTDEHGDKIAEAAQKAGQTPQEYADTISGLFRDMWPGLDITNDDFIRTTEERHKKVVQEVLQKVYDKGDIYFGEYGGHYCKGCECFLTEKDLVDGLCPDHKVAPEYISEKNYFFRMSKYRDALLQHIAENPDFIRPERYRKEVVSLLESGDLEDLCISRPKSRLEWGIELPFDTDYVCYVWFDALLNYISAMEYPEGEKYQKYWPCVQHLVAKDILKPHAVFWPTMLMSAEIPLYQHLNVHGYWLIKDTKMSKSLGNVVAPLDMVDKYGLDTFRYFLLREMRFGNDASFSEEGLVARRNADLANDLGNLFSRSLSMAHKYFGGVVPRPERGEPDVELKELAENAFANFANLFDRANFAQALEALWELVRGLNKYIDSSAPWGLFKERDMEGLAQVMYPLLECLHKVAVCLQPVMPEASSAMLKQLGSTSGLSITEETGQWGRLTPGTKLAKASNLFPRVELAVQASSQAPGDEPKQSAPKGKARKADKGTKAAKNDGTIDFEDFQKLDMRVGTVVSCALHPDADRLLLVKVDLGENEPRNVVAGLAGFFSPEELKGRQVVLVANLKPRKLRGYVSQGMILAVKTEQGMQLLTPTDQVGNGAKVS